MWALIHYSKIMERHVAVCEVFVIGFSLFWCLGALSKWAEIQDLFARTQDAFWQTTSGQRIAIFCWCKNGYVPNSRESVVFSHLEY